MYQIAKCETACAKDDIQVSGGLPGQVLRQTTMGAVSEGQRKVDGFRRSVDMKREEEIGKEGWKSDAFDL